MCAYGASRYGRMTDRASFERNRPPDAVRRRSSIQCLYLYCCRLPFFQGAFFMAKREIAANEVSVC